MADKTKELRQAQNQIFIQGVLKEKNLEVLKDEKGGVIRGDLIIDVTGPDDKLPNEVKVNVYVSEFTSKGAANRAYPGIMTVNETYVSMVDVLNSTTEGEEPDLTRVDKVMISKAQFGVNDFYANGDMINHQRVGASFISRVKDVSKYVPKAEFALEGFFKKIQREKDEDQEDTNKLVVEMIVPIYGGAVIPLTVVAYDEIADYLEDEYEVGKTSVVWGNVISNVVQETKVQKGFGKDRERTFSKTTVEFVVDGGNEEQFDEDDPKAYKVDAIRAALVERDAMLEQKKAKAIAKEKRGKGKAQGGASTKPNREKKNIGNDIPF